MFFKKLKLSTNKSANDVCLSEDKLIYLQNLAKQTNNKFEETTKMSAENMAGDLQSRVRGAGVDFEENKPYQTGSDSRHINWRTYARTQQLFVNIYNEDKRPSTYIVLDQRTSMYFGTRKQLKIKQALNIAIYYIYRAMHRQQNVSGVQILNKPIWHSIYSGAQSISAFSKLLNNPHISNVEDKSKPHINSILSKLNLTSGAELVIVSDFRDMNTETITALYNLSRTHKIELIQIQDPIEVEIPTKGIYNIKNNTEDQPITLNCNKKIQKEYRETIKTKFEHYITQCKNMGINFNQFLTTDSIFSEQQ